MVVDHESMYEIEDNTILWKYMSFSKFVNLLTGNLYMNRIDQFEDVFECHIPVKTREVIEKSGYEQIIKMEDLGKRIIYISCFHAAECETAFMWHQYSQEGGIAIRTTAGKVKEALKSTNNEIYMSRVEYIDYSTAFIDPSNVFNLAIHKRKSFEFEREVRCICMHFPEGLVAGTSIYEMDIPRGIKVSVNLDALIDKIYISPYAPHYLEENIRLLMGKFGLDKEVINSNLYQLE